jgi:hypothetical protein
MKPAFKILDFATVNHTMLDAFADRVIHQTVPWLRFIQATQNAIPVIAELRQGEETLGYFTGLIVEKFGFKILGSPFPGWSTTYMGFNLHSRVSRATAIEALTDFAFDDLRCHHVELMDRYMKPEDYHALDYDTWMFEGYEIDLTLSEDQLFANMKPTCRTCVRKAYKSGVTIEEANDEEFADEYYEQLAHVFHTKDLTPPFGVDRVRQLIKFVQPTGNLLLLRARNKDGICIATGIFPALNRTMYFWGGASWRHWSQVRPNEAIMWYAMKYWKKRGIALFDMVGMGDYKKKYGAYEIAVPWVRKSRNTVVAFLRSNAEWAFYKWQHLSGRLSGFLRG